MMTWKDLVPWMRDAKFVPTKKEEGSPLHVLQREVNQTFDSFFSALKIDQPFHLDSAKPKKGFSPSVDVEETDASLVIQVELAGMNENDVEILINETYLRIKGEKRIRTMASEGGYTYYESFYGPFERCVPLPETVETESIHAAMKNGLLVVTMKKTIDEGSRARKIPITKEESNP